MVQIEKAPQEFDALVLEHGLAYAPEKAVLRRSYKNVVEQAVEGRKQIWITDAKPTARTRWRYYAGLGYELGSVFGGQILALKALWRKTFPLKAKKEKITRRAFIKKAILIGLLSPGFVYSCSGALSIHQKEIKHHKAWKAHTKMGELIEGKWISTARDLVTAEKCESFLAPKLQQELGRKPTIAMVWGSGHYGIRDLLLHPEKRQRLLQKYDLGKYLKADYPKSFRIELKPDGTIREIKEFPNTLQKQKKAAELPKPKAQQPELLNRRQLFSKAFDRMRRL